MVLTEDANSGVELQQILEALVTLPPAQVAEVRDFVLFLQERYGGADEDSFSDDWSQEDLADATRASIQHAENSVWSAEDEDASAR